MVAAVGHCHAVVVSSDSGHHAGIDIDVSPLDIHAATPHGVAQATACVRVVPWYCRCCYCYWSRALVMIAPNKVLSSTTVHRAAVVTTHYHFCIVVVRFILEENRVS